MREYIEMGIVVICSLIPSNFLNGSVDLLLSFDMNLASSLIAYYKQTTAVLWLQFEHKAYNESNTPSR